MPSRDFKQEIHSISSAQRGSIAGVDDWVLSLLGEVAARLGDAGAAQQHFRSALALAPKDAYALGAYADLLLDQGQPGQLAIVAVFLPIAYRLRATAFYRRMVLTGGSAGIALLALVWLTERAFAPSLAPLGG